MDGNTISYKVGVDIGGTFTDIVGVSSDGRVITYKVPSTPEDYSEGILDGLNQALQTSELSASEVSEIVHGTTIATNAILERRGARTALITTRGFRDVLELRRLRIPELYNLNWEKPPSLVPRYLRYEVAERVDFLGNVLEPLDEQRVIEIAGELKRAEVESVAVCLINSYCNPTHEQRIGELLSEHLPEVFVSLSTDIIRELKEYERTSTAVVDAYVRPVVEQYLNNLERRLDEKRIQSRLLIMQSNGALMNISVAKQHPCFLTESGPAAGVIASSSIAEQLGIDNVITLDMGGTTAKAAIIESGKITLTDEYELGAGITTGSRLLKGGGYLLRIPAIDLAEVGAGGGSLARVDSGGALQVGPESAGAIPGPACYGNGNMVPTITDANVVLGYIDPESIAGGALTIDPDLSWAAVCSLGEELSLSPLDTAFAIHVIGNTRMSRAIQAVSTERGRDVREFTLLAFGGSGPIHAVHLAQSLGMRRVVIPPLAGLFSSVGLVFSRIGHQFTQTFRAALSDESRHEFLDALQAIRRTALGQVLQLGYARHQLQVTQSIDLQYSGQSFSLNVELPDTDPTASGNLIRFVREAFQSEHRQTYGHASPVDPIEVVNLRATVQVVDGSWNDPIATALRGITSDGSNTSSKSTRRALFSRERGLEDARIMSRNQLAESATGPFLIEEDDTTIVVPPECAAMVDDWGNLIIEVAGRSWS
jgi:N-methylhydantoinase A